MSEAADRFWTWSLAFYAKPGVSEALLRLQNERGLTVNALLFCLWTGTEGRRLCPERLAGIDDTLRRYNPVTAGLRAARDALKPLASGACSGSEFGGLSEKESAAHGDLRKQILALELTAERLQQAALVTNLPPVTEKERQACARQNLTDHLLNAGQAAEIIQTREISHLIQSAF